MRVYPKESKHRRVLARVDRGLETVKLDIKNSQGNKSLLISQIVVYCNNSPIISQESWELKVGNYAKTNALAQKIINRDIKLLWGVTSIADSDFSECKGGFSIYERFKDRNVQEYPWKREENNHRYLQWMGTEEEDFEYAGGTSMPDVFKGTVIETMPLTYREYWKLQYELHMDPERQNSFPSCLLAIEKE